MTRAGGRRQVPRADRGRDSPGARGWSPAAPRPAARASSGRRVLADVTDAMLIAREETFGPVAAMLPFDTEEEVSRRANATEMGLAAYLYTNDLRRTLRVTEALEYGMVGVNTASFTGPPIPSAAGSSRGSAAKAPATVWPSIRSSNTSASAISPPET